jgi:hypothetical protein
MHISTSTLATVALVVWFAYVVMPSLKEWGEECRWNQEYKAKKV